MNIEVKFGKIKSEKEERISNLLVELIDLFHEYMVMDKLLRIAEL